MSSNQKQPWDTNIFLFPLEMSPMYAKDLTKLKPRNQQIKRNIFNNCNERECKKEYMCVLSHFSHVRLCDPMDRSPPSLGFSRQEYWNGLPCPPPGDLPNPGIKPVSYVSWNWQVSLPLMPSGKPIWPPSQVC